MGLMNPCLGQRAPPAHINGDMRLGIKKLTENLKEYDGSVALNFFITKNLFD